MKKFINKETGDEGIIISDTPEEMQVRIGKTPILWTGTREEFERDWQEVKSEASPVVPTAEVFPYTYFVTFVDGGRAGSCSVGRHSPVTSIEDIKDMQAKLSESGEVVIIGFRVFDTRPAVYDWAETVYPAVQKLLAEIRQVPNWAGYFEPENRELLERMVNYESLGIQEKNETSPVADQLAGAEEINPGATDKG